MLSYYDEILEWQSRLYIGMPMAGVRLMLGQLGWTDWLDLNSPTNIIAYRNMEYELAIQFSEETQLITQMDIRALSKKEQKKQVRPEDYYRSKAAASRKPPPVGRSLPSDEEYAVYTAVCQSKFQRGKLIFDDLTRSILYPFTESIAQTAAKHHCPEIVTDYLTKNAYRARLERKFECPYGFRFFSELPLEEAKEGITSIWSRVGFNKEQTLAIVYYEWPGPYYGYHYELIKYDNEWKLIGETMLFRCCEA